MSILKRIENATQSFILKSLSTHTIYNALDKRLGDKISLQIVPTANPRALEDVGTWIKALKRAEHPDLPSRRPLYNLYEVVDIDNHLTSLVSKRVLRVQGSKFRIDMNGQADEKATDMLQTEWFNDFLQYAMESIFWGHSLIQFNELVEGQFESVDLINRKHVKPEAGQWLVNDTDNEGPIYRGTNVMDWYIEVGRPKNLGLYKKAAPMALWKKNSFAQWSQYNELFGIPFRTIKTPARDPKRMDVLEQIAANMGSAGWAIIQDDEAIEVMMNSGAPADKIFNMLIERCNTEMSKLILHQTMTSDNGSSRSQAEVHEDVAEEVHYADKRMMEFVVNRKLLPLLTKHGYPVAGKKFQWDDTRTLSPEERIKIDQVLLQHYDLDPEYIEETYSVPVKPKAKATAPGINPDEPEDPNEPENPNDPEEKQDPGKKKALTTARNNIQAFMQAHTCPKCGGANVRFAFAGKTQEQIQDLLLKIGKALHDGDQISPLNLELYEAYSRLLTEGIEKGIGLNTGTVDYSTPDHAMLAFMRTNIHAFSGGKSLQELRDLRAMLQDEKGGLKSWAQFRNSVLELHKDYNENWLAAEYDTAVATSQMASKWRQIKENASTMPYLEYVTAGDERVSPEHREFEGITLPVHSDFWNHYWPPLRFRCRCNIVQHAFVHPDKLMTEDEAGLRVKGIKIPKMFKRNPGKDGVVFTTDHPYLTGKDVNAWDSEKHYGMRSLDDIASRIPKSRKRKELTDQDTADLEFQRLMKPHQVEGSDIYEIKSKTGDVITFQPGFLNHMKEEKQLREERWKLFPEIEKALTDPDEVWTVSLNYNQMSNFNSVYIRYYEDGAVVVGTNSKPSTNGRILAKTVYLSEVRKGSRLSGARRGVLMYRKK